MGKRRSSGTPATTKLTQMGIAFELLEYEHDPLVTDFGREAASALGLPPEQVFKTLIIEVDRELAVAVVPVSGTLNLKAFAQACGGKKAHLAPAQVAERKTGYVLGGVSPIGQRTQLQTVIDESALLQETVLVSAGKRGSDIKLLPEDLARATGGRWADIGRE